MGWLRDGSIPLRFQGGVAAPLIKRSRSSAAQTGWLVNSNKIRCATRISLRRLRDLLLTTPSAPLRNGIFLSMAQPPLLENGGEWARLATYPVPLHPASLLSKEVLAYPI